VEVLRVVLGRRESSAVGVFVQVAQTNILLFWVLAHVPNSFHCGAHIADHLLFALLNPQTSLLDVLAQVLKFRFLVLMALL
jgi:hypothetical protein